MAQIPSPGFSHLPLGSIKLTLRPLFEQKYEKYTVSERPISLAITFLTERRYLFLKRTLSIVNYQGYHFYDPPH